MIVSVQAFRIEKQGKGTRRSFLQNFNHWFFYCVEYADKRASNEWLLVHPYQLLRTLAHPHGLSVDALPMYIWRIKQERGTKRSAESKPTTAVPASPKKPRTDSSDSSPQPARRTAAATETHRGHPSGLANGIPLVPDHECEGEGEGDRMETDEDHSEGVQPPYG
jgi:hypothetical protein